ncbi:MAG TPA: hypothetical protein VNS32_25985, partial [Flavisolibacter sp.]|nr:hypothetical protein [Flavisolibacter sp.]
ELASPEKRNIFINVLGKSDPLIKDALQTILQRSAQQPAETNKSNISPLPSHFSTLNDYDFSVVDKLIAKSERSLTDLKNEIKNKSGAELINFILEDIQQLKTSLSDPESFGVIMTGMNAATWLNEKMFEWLGEKNAADKLSQSVPNNITSAMGLALLDVSDAMRPYPEVIEYLNHVNSDDFLQDMQTIAGGRLAKEAIEGFLNKYGMRCVGEIDITKPRWSEKPSTLVPLILSNIKNFKPGESKRKFESGLREALDKRQDLLKRLKELPDGDQKEKEASRMIDLVRNLGGYREYPKYSMVTRYFVYKQALLKEAERLVASRVLETSEDIIFLRLIEIREIGYGNRSNTELIEKRKEDYKRF